MVCGPFPGTDGLPAEDKALDADIQPPENPDGREDEAPEVDKAIAHRAAIGIGP